MIGLWTPVVARSVGRLCTMCMRDRRARVAAAGCITRPGITWPRGQWCGVTICGSRSGCAPTAWAILILMMRRIERAWAAVARCMGAMAAACPTERRT